MTDVIDFDKLKKIIEPVFKAMENDIKENEVRKNDRIIKSYLENNSGNVRNLRSK